MSGVFRVDGEAYDAFMGRYSTRLAPRFADFAGVGSGARVLDVGAGTGALTAELGTMNVTEQLDALRVMGTDPIRHLVVPRFIACVLLTPILTIYSDMLGVLGGWLISTKFLHVPDAPLLPDGRGGAPLCRADGQGARRHRRRSRRTGIGAEIARRHR